MRHLVLALVLACSPPEDAKDPLETDADAVPSDTVQADTAVPGDSGPVVDTGDTGATPLDVMTRIVASGSSSWFCTLDAGELDCWGAMGDMEVPEGPFVDLDLGGFDEGGDWVIGRQACALRASDGHPVCFGSSDDDVPAPPDEALDEVDLGLRGACGVRSSDGTVVCWGGGVGTPPSQPLTNLEVVWRLACGLDATTSEMVCWGDDVPDALPEGPFVDLDGGAIGGQVCGLRATGEVECVRNGAVNLTALDSPPGVSVTRMAVGMVHACGIATGTDEVVCWGMSDRGIFDASAGSLGYNRAIAIPAGTRAADVAVAYDHTCIVDADDGHVACWGSTLGAERVHDSRARYAELAWFDRSLCATRVDGTIDCVRETMMGGLDGPAPSPASAVPPPGVAFDDVDLAHFYGCGIVRGTGAVTCWGTEGLYRSNIPYLTPPGPGPYRDVAVNNVQACAIRQSDQGVDCWGLVDGDDTPPTGAFESIVAGRVHLCGLRTDGTAVCWGHDANGQASPPDTSFAALALGREISCGLRTDDRTAVCWGREERGARLVPEGVAWSAIAFEEVAGCGIAEATGQVSCWGYGPAAVAPTGLPTARAIGMTSGTACMIAEGSGELICWGDMRRNLPR